MPSFQAASYSHSPSETLTGDFTQLSIPDRSLLFQHRSAFKSLLMTKPQGSLLTIL